MVAIFPSDHFMVDEARFMAYVHRAVVETERFPQEMTLLGMTPDRAEEGYGWIEGAEQPGRETLSEVCERCTSWLRVLPVPDLGWSDWGSAERVLGSLQRIGKLDECLAWLRKREVVFALPFEESSLSGLLTPPAARPRIATWEHSPVTGGTRRPTERQSQPL
jgi:hypothetical protein